MELPSINLTKDEFITKVEKDPELKSTDKIGPYNIISIDPGFENLGVVLAEVEGDLKKKNYKVTILQKVTFRLMEDKEPKSINNLVTRVVNFIFKAFPDSESVTKSAVLIEDQYFNKNAPYVSCNLRVLQAIMYTLFSWKYNSMTTSINSKSVKQKYDLMTGSNYQNKKKTTEFVKKHLLKDENVEITNHVADCVLQIDYFLKYMDANLKNFTTDYQIKK